MNWNETKSTDSNWNAELMIPNTKERFITQIIRILYNEKRNKYEFPVQKCQNRV